MKAPHEFKIMRVRECIAPSQLIDTPQLAFEYWKANIPSAPWFDDNKEVFVVLILNTRRRIIGHNLVAIGTLDNVVLHPRELFRPIILMAGSAAILMHNHPSLVIPHPVLCRTRVGITFKNEQLKHCCCGIKQ